MTYSSEHRQRIAQAGKSGGARKAFVARVCAATDEHLAGALSAWGLAQEVISAVRDLRGKVAR